MVKTTKTTRTHLNSPTSVLRLIADDASRYAELLIDADVTVKFAGNFADDELSGRVHGVTERRYTRRAQPVGARPGKIVTRSEIELDVRASVGIVTVSLAALVRINSLA